MSSEVEDKQSGADYWASQPNIIPVSGGLNASNTGTDLSNLNSEKGSHSSYGSDNPFLLEVGSPLAEKEIPLTDEESLLNDEFYQEINDIVEKNKQKYDKITKESIQKYRKDWAKDDLIEEIIQKCGEDWTKNALKYALIEEIIREYGKDWTKDNLIEEIIQRSGEDWTKYALKYALIEEVTQKYGKDWTKDVLIKEITQKSEEIWVRGALKNIKGVVDKYLKEGIKLNSYCDDNRITVVNLILEKIKDVFDDVTEVTSGRFIYYSEDSATDKENVSITQDIIKNLLLKGGKVKRDSFYNDRISHATMGFINSRNKGFHEEKQFDECLFDECKYIMDQLKSAVYESIVNKNKQIQDELEISIDNIYSYIKYPQGSIVEIVKITNELEVENLELEVCELEIGGSIVRIDIEGEDRNYTDIAGSDGIVLTFYTSLGELEVKLYLDEEDENLIRVEVRDQEKLEKLKSCNEKIGENCFLGGLLVNEAIEQGYFERSRELCQSSERVSSSKKIKEGVLEAVKDLEYDDIVNSSSNFCREDYAENQGASMNSSRSVQRG